MIIKSGDIEVIVNEPLFSSNSVWYPGYAETKSFQVKNRGNKTKQVQIETLSENETQNLSQGLNLEVRNDASCVYGCNEAKTLRNFFDTGNVNAGEAPADDNGKVFTINVAMPIAAEDKYQDGKISFDLKIGLEGDESSSVVVQGDSTAADSGVSNTVVLGDANNANWHANDANEADEEGEILGQEVTPMVTSGTAAGETANGNNNQNNWWPSWWWLALLLILIALMGWWNRRKNRYTG